ncbi:hypothetical protein AAFF_G00379980 [Aldrovandia affinis]|uniref:Uncharacterized protein n=1 Tax=Aldrovandia affinis TaxID=143900 RepID=A0AAD7WZY9_9TELE|nr:hypothetical protein AAFF_G00379980 [Aldrovandia affinis]
MRRLTACDPVRASAVLHRYIDATAVFHKVVDIPGRASVTRHSTKSITTSWVFNFRRSARGHIYTLNIAVNSYNYLKGIKTNLLTDFFTGGAVAARKIGLQVRGDSNLTASLTSSSSATPHSEAS